MSAIKSNMASLYYYYVFESKTFVIFFRKVIRIYIFGALKIEYEKSGDNYYIRIATTILVAMDLAVSVKTTLVL